MQLTVEFHFIIKVRRHFYIYKNVKLKHFKVEFYILFHVKAHVTKSH